MLISCGVRCSSYRPQSFPIKTYCPRRRSITPTNVSPAWSATTCFCNGAWLFNLSILLTIHANHTTHTTREIPRMVLRCTGVLLLGKALKEVCCGLAVCQTIDEAMPVGAPM